jgi:hypothetical protein
MFQQIICQFVMLHFIGGANAKNMICRLLFSLKHFQAQWFSTFCAHLTIAMEINNKKS